MSLQFIPKFDNTFFVSLFVGLVMIAGCQYSSSVENPQLQPQKKDLVGVWEPTSDSIYNMRNRGHYNISQHQLILREDGTFSMINMPDCVFSGWSSGWESSRGKFKSGTGNWSLIKYENRWDVWFGLSDEKTGELPSVSSPVLSGQHPPFILNFSFGDLDFGHAMKFCKTPKKIL